MYLDGWQSMRGLGPELTVPSVDLELSFSDFPTAREARVARVGNKSRESISRGKIRKSKSKKLSEPE
jgi:hypothetical protein